MRILMRLYQQILSLRYRVKITGEEYLFSKSVFVLPNHVALIDPQILLVYLNKFKKLNPLSQKSYYDNKFLRPIFKALGAIRIDNDISSMSRDDVEQTTQSIVQALEEWKNIIAYPSGQLKMQWRESIIGKKVAYEVLSKIPQNTRVLLVRTTGLWWSSSSKAREWKTPSLAFFFLKWLWYLIANFFVLVPKRDVHIHIEDVTELVHKKNTENRSLDECNKRLEDRYNLYWPEMLRYIKYYFYYNNVKHKEIPDIQWSQESLKQVKDYTNIQYDQKIFDFVVEQIKTMKPDAPAQEMSMGTHVVFDLFFDSLDTAELKSAVQSMFSGSSNPPLLDLKLVGDYVMMGMGKSVWEEYLKACEWDYEGANETRFLSQVVGEFSETDTIPYLMKKAFKRDMWHSFCYDTIFWVQSRRDYLIKAYLLADILKQYPWEYIGIMLPAITGTSLLVTAAYLAQKIPVMMNWTLSQEAFEHCMKYKELPAVITSKTFYNKIQMPYYEQYTMVFLEDLLKKISLKQKLTALYKSYFFAIPKQHEEAVILFTSWSEWLPKAVPITHQNIIQDIKWALQLVSFKTDDILLWFLPPFHSFWFTITTVCPLITGIRAVYSPDPNDAVILAKLMEHTQATGIASTPTFFKRILWVWTAKQLASLRVVIVGAEKCPPELFEWIAKKVPWAKLIEWYGITECSPVISVNPLEKPKPWTVWLPIIWLDMIILDLDTKEPLTQVGREWMVYVSWPSVFSWYMDKNLEDPFVQINNKKFYKTWDLGFLDKDWYLTLTGRLKRFIKIAGEMVSLPYIEKIMQEKYGKEDELNLAVEAIELPDGKAKIVLFSTEKDNPISLKEANLYLRNRGVANIVSLAEIAFIDTIPVLWTWKTDYKVLKKMIKI